MRHKIGPRLKGAVGDEGERMMDGTVIFDSVPAKIIDLDIFGRLDFIENITTSAVNQFGETAAANQFGGTAVTSPPPPRLLQAEEALERPPHVRYGCARLLRSDWHSTK